MSDNKKKALLNEATTKRFWTLAGLKPIHEKAYLFEEEEELEEMRASKEDDKEEVDEGMRGAKEDEKEVDEMRAPQGSGIKGVYTDKSDDDEFEPTTKKVGTKGSTVTTAKARKMNEDDLDEESDLEERGMDMAAEDEPEPEMDMGAEEGPEDGQDVEVDVPEGDVASLRTARDILDQILSAVDGGADEEPEMDIDAEEPEMEEEPALQEGEEEELNEIDQEELEEIAERIAARVARRITESLKIKK